MKRVPAFLIAVALVFPKSDSRSRIGVAAAMTNLTSVAIGLVLAAMGWILIPTWISIAFSIASATLFFAGSWSTGKKAELVPGFVMAGAAVACKYPALLFTVIPLLVAVVVYAWARYRAPRGSDTSEADAPRALNMLGVTVRQLLIASLATALAPTTRLRI